MTTHEAKPKDLSLSGGTKRKAFARISIALLIAPLLQCLAVDTQRGSPLSPSHLAASKDGAVLFVACPAANRVVRIDVRSHTILDSIPLPAAPSGLALWRGEHELLVTCGGSNSKVHLVDPPPGKILASVPAGHAATGPLLSPDGTTLYVCNRFDHDVSVIDLTRRKELRRIPVSREPVAACLSADGSHLLVANRLPAGRANADLVAASVSVIDLASGQVARELQLPNGSSQLQDIRSSPDGRYAVLPHLVSSFGRATTQVHMGWLNANAITLIDLNRLAVLGTVLLDTPGSGAASPWGLAWTDDGRTLVVTHAGTHEISVIDFPALLAASRNFQEPSSAAASSPESLPGRPQPSPAETPTGVLTRITRYEGLNPGLPFLTGARRRVKLPPTDRGPRAVTIIGHTAFVANYFSDTLSVVDLSDPGLKPESFSLHSPDEPGPALSPEAALARKGESCFHDATICFQGWQSCSSCHPDGRADGLNWDLLNDGIGNPKNTKSLLLAFQTPPAMSLGVRESPADAVRAGIRHILFSKQPEEVALAIEAYIKSLKPVPSPYLENGKLTRAARRGQKVFAQAGCAVCHPPGLFTDLRSYNVGTAGSYDNPGDKFDTPTLVELWRTAPYLHDGSAATLRDLLTTRNPLHQHGRTSGLTSRQLDDLCTYLLSL